MDSVIPAWRPDLGNGRYKNPVLFADYSDPDILRHGEDFYLVASSFNHMPALPLLHSRDLVNWRIVNHVFDRFDLAGYDDFQPGKGVWAPSIRFHDGQFWVFFSTPDEGIFMCHTRDPLGTWSAPHCLKAVRGWIDPCPFWDDDGTAWLVHAFAFSRCATKHKLQICRMAADGSRLLDEGRILYDGSADLPTLEGPKVYKRHGWYYVFAPAGGVATGWQTVLRARDLQGPWQQRTVLHQGSSAVNGPHQGGWVELEGGENWFIHFQDQYTYGRVAHLQPMCWQDDWPIIGSHQPGDEAGQPVAEWLKPTVSAPQPLAEPQTSDDFSGDRLGLQWQWQANPQPDWYRLDDHQLRLYCQPMPLRDGLGCWYDVANLLLQKFPAPTFVVTCRMTPCLMLNGEQSGLIVYGERFAWLGAEQSEQGLHWCSGYGWINDRGQVETRSQRLGAVPPGAALTLRLTVSAHASCCLAYSTDGQQFTDIKPGFAAGPGKWVGAKMGLYALSPPQPDGQQPPSAPGGSAGFSRFEVAALGGHSVPAVQ